MSDMGRARRTYTHEELDGIVRSLWGVGGVYEHVAAYVEKWERPRCTGEKTNTPPPWLAPPNR